jgi:hypothetical protein
MRKLHKYEYEKSQKQMIAFISVVIIAYGLNIYHFGYAPFLNIRNDPNKKQSTKIDSLQYEIFIDDCRHLEEDMNNNFYKKIIHFVIGSFF